LPPWSEWKHWLPFRVSRRGRGKFAEVQQLKTDAGAWVEQDVRGTRPLFLIRWQRHHVPPVARARRSLSSLRTTISRYLGSYLL
jgi:hypothetical protein